MKDTNNENPTISIVCPCYNEALVLHLFINELQKTLNQVKLSFEIILINDGSSDNTLEKMLQIKLKIKNIKIIHLSRNFGKESALSAGLDYAQGEVIIPIDADLQDPPSLIVEFIKHWRAGSDVVLAKRIDREVDNLAKSYSANLFYKVHNKISDIQIPKNVGDFRLITKKVLKDIQKLPENQRFMKGIFAWVGYTPTIVEYKREKREAGKTSFNAWKLWNLAIDGITSFSTIPLRIWFYIGLFISFISFVYGTYIIFRTLFLGVDVPGYASILTAILFLGGIQLIGIGILGEYIGRIYFESKKRPIYIIQDIF